MQYGEIVELGRHRLMCGDATKSEDVHALVGGERVDLVLTDPPYGYHFQDANGRVGSNTPSSSLSGGAYRGRSYPQLIGNDSSDTARLHYPIARALTNRLIIWGGNNFTDFLPVSRGWFVWDKGLRAKSFGEAELAWTTVIQQIKHVKFLWSGAVRAGTRALNPKPRVHPTQKPVELHARILEDFSQDGDVILDCFGGSGTTLIACEVTHRRCLMMELSPEYCDVIINRYNTLTQGGINFA